jgi:hypothetical protein
MDNIINRINRIFEGVVGCTFEFQAADVIDQNQWKLGDLDFAQDSDLVPQFIENSDRSAVAFPVKTEGHLTGLAVVRGLSAEQPPKLMMLAELVSMVLEHSARTEERGERLRMIEERLRVMDENSNVISLRRSRQGQAMQITDLSDLIDQSAPLAPALNPISAMPLLIETKPGFPLHRIAVEIHQLSKRWAIVNSNDLPADIFMNRQALTELGSLTLFIPDLAELTTGQQIKLAEYLATKPGPDAPHVIAGVVGTALDLEARGQLLPYLSRLFCISNLQWTDKTPDQINKEFVTASLNHILEQAREEMKHEDAFLPFSNQHLDPSQKSFH